LLDPQDGEGGMAFEEEDENMMRELDQKHKQYQDELDKIKQMFK
jgi:hypothetical protein